MEVVDVDSELMELNRKNSKDPNQHYKPDDEKIIKYINLEDGFFQESTLLNNPPQLLRSQIKIVLKVFLKLSQDILEPFDRLGTQIHI